MRLRTPTLLAAAVLTGAVVAFALALIARAGDPDAATPATAREPVVVAPWREPVGGGFVRLQATTTPRIEARAEDPAGGPPWAIRVFDARRRANISRAPVGKPNICAQLGRIVDGRFGWVDADNRFRPGRVSFFDAPTLCLRRPLEPQLQTLTTISVPAGGEPRGRSHVVWGIAGERADLKLLLDGRSSAAPPTPRGVVLVVRRDGGEHVDARLRVRYRDGRRVGTGHGRFPGGSSTFGRGSAPDRRPRPGVAPRIELRLPDPNGGPPWGIAATPTVADGAWCISPLGRILGNRVGAIDERHGTFLDGPTPGDCRPPRTTRGRPLSFGWGSAGALEETIFPGQPSTMTAGRVTRRTLRGSTSFYGTARADVVSITTATPRDVRTITPSPRAHAWAAIYDGDFPVGEIRISARLRDGSVHRERPISIMF